MTDLVKASGLSNGAIYRYFTSKDEIVAAICAQSSQGFPAELTVEAIDAFLQHIRTLAREKGHARLVAQIFAEAAVTPGLAALVEAQLEQMRTAVGALLPDHPPAHAARISESFVALCHAYSQQLAVRGDLDPEPFTAALVAIATS